ILQHAWAEIEHDLGYKAGNIPDKFRRRFSRVSALLELADEEFMNLKRGLATYAAAAADVGGTKADALLDRVTLKAFIHQDQTLLKLEEKVRLADSELTEPHSGWLDSHVEDLRYLGMAHVGSLRSAYARHANNIGTVIKLIDKDFRTHDAEEADQIVVKGW